MGGMFIREFAKMDASKIKEVIELLEMMKNCPLSNAYVIKYHIASMEPSLGTAYENGYAAGYEKGVEEALRIINERLTPYE